jgi:hypothetical protein
MPISRRARRIVWALLLSVTAAPAASAASLWAWQGGTASWCDPFAWSPSTWYPDDGNGGLTFDVDFGSGSAALDCGAISIQALNLTGGTIDAADDLSLNALFTWSAGTLGGTGATRADGGLTLAGSAQKNLADTRLLVLAAGSSSSWDDGNLSLGAGGATLRTEAGATLTVAAPGSSLSDDSDSGFFDNQGSFVVALPGSADVFTVSAGTLTNSGLIDVQQGRLYLVGMGSHTGLLQGAGTLRSIGTTTLQSGASLTGSGVEVVGGLLEVLPGATFAAQDTALIGAANGTLRVTGPATTATTGTGRMTGSGAILEGDGSFTSNGAFILSVGIMRGSGTTRIEGGLTITNSGTKLLEDSRTLVLGAGSSSSWEGGDLRLHSDASLRTEPAAILTVTAAGRRLHAFGVSVSATFDNQGSFVVDLPDPVDVFTLLGGTLANSGLIDVQQGILSLGTGSHTGVLRGAGTVRQNGLKTTLQSGASLTVARVEVEGGTLEVLPDATFAVQHTALTSPAGGSLRVAGPATTATTVTGLLSGDVAWLEGDGTFVSTGVFTFDTGTMRGSGTTRIEGGLTITGSGTKTLMDTRTLLLATGSSSSWDDGDLGLAGGSATLRTEAGATLTVTAPSRSLIQGFFDNQGSFVSSLPGAADVFTLAAGSHTNTGTFDVEHGMLEIEGPFSQTAGSLRLSGGSITASVPLEIAGGALEGTGALTAHVTLGGVLSPGLSVGKIDIAGDLTCTATAVSRFELEGFVRGVDYDAVDVSGAVVLAGSLDLPVLPNVAGTLGPGDGFTLLVAGGGLSGTFSNVANGDRLFYPNGDSFVTHYGPGAPQPNALIADGFRRWEPVGALVVSGLATGGTITITIAGITLVVSIDPGDTPGEIAQKIADAIAADPVLRALGAFGKTEDGRVVVNEPFDQAETDDPGLTIQIALRTPALSWLSRGLLGVALALGFAAARRSGRRSARGSRASLPIIPSS